MDQYMRAALDRHITGNWGEDQFRGQEGLEEEDPCGSCGETPGSCQCSNGAWRLEGEVGHQVWVQREFNENRPDFGNIIQEVAS